MSRHAEDIRGNAKAVEAAAQAQAASAAAATTTGPQRSRQPYESDIVVIAGFKRESPRGALMAAWQHTATS